jgi:hypothetical protein
MCDVAMQIRDLEAELVALKGTQEPIAWADPKDLVQDGYSHSFYVHQVPLGNINCAPLYLSPPNEKQIKAAALREAAEIVIDLRDKHLLLRMAEELLK